MTFPNEKKTYLSKQDKSKKGDIDERVIPVLEIINAKEDDYYYNRSKNSFSAWFLEYFDV